MTVILVISLRLSFKLRFEYEYFIVFVQGNWSWSGGRFNGWDHIGFFMHDFTWIGKLCSNYSVIMMSGAAIKKAGGKDFETEVQNLHKSHGNLEVAAGRQFNR